MLLKTQLANGRRAQRGSILEEHGARHRSLAPRTSSTFVTCEDRVLGKLVGEATNGSETVLLGCVSLDEAGKHTPGFVERVFLKKLFPSSGGSHSGFERRTTHRNGRGACERRRSPDEGCQRALKATMPRAQAWADKLCVESAARRRTFPDLSAQSTFK